MIGLSVVKDRIEIPVVQTVRMFAGGLKLHQIDDIHNADFQVRQILAKDGDGGKDFQRGHITAAGHHHIRLRRPGRCWPIPRCRCLQCNARTAASIDSHCGAGCLPATTTFT